MCALQLDESGQPVTAEDEGFQSNEEEHRIGVVHPTMLSASLRQQWIERFRDFEIVQVFEQLERPIHEPDEVDDLSKWLLTLLSEPLEPKALDQRWWTIIHRGATHIVTRWRDGG